MFLAMPAELRQLQEGSSPLDIFLINITAE